MVLEAVDLFSVWKYYATRASVAFTFLAVSKIISVVGATSQATIENCFGPHGSGHCSGPN